MKYNKLSNKIKLSSALIAATTIISSGILSMPLLLSTNNNNINALDHNDNQQIMHQANNQTTNVVDLKTQPVEIQSFFLNTNTKIYMQNDSDSLFAVVTKDTGYDVLYAWGINGYGQLGVDNKIDQPYPTLVPNLPVNSKITHIVSSSQATTIVINENQIWVSGYNFNYEMGDPSLGSTQKFVQNKKWNGANVKSLHAGFRHRIITTKDSVWVWGWNDFGQLGTGVLNDHKDTFFDFTSKIAAAYPNWASGEFFASGNNSAIIINGKLYMWGKNNDGQTGNSGSEPVVSLPTAHVPTLENIAKYSMGSNHSLAILERGSLAAWGANSSGQLGLNHYSAVRTPTRIYKTANSSDVINVSNVSATGSTSFITIAEGTFSTGGNNLGILAQDVGVTSTPQYGLVNLLANTEVLNVVTTATTVIFNQKSGLYMAGSNSDGQFASGVLQPSIPHYSLELVTPFGSPVKIKTKIDNKWTNADNVVADLVSKTTAATIKAALAKYTDYGENLGSILLYKTPPVASIDKEKVTMILTTNSTYNLDGAKIGSSFDIFLEITNFWFKDSAVIIKRMPVNVNTGNIKTLLNPNPGSIPSDQWWNGIVDMDRFPPNTTFTIIIKDEIIPGTGTDGIYKGEIVPSKYYYGNAIVTVPRKSFKFEFTGLKKVADSLFSFTTINPDLNLGNIDIELPAELPINDKYLPMFVNLSTFPADAKFKISNPLIDVDNKTYSGILSVDKYYKDGILTSGSIDFSFSNFKTIQTSSLDFMGFKNDDIHSSNINELLVNSDMTVNNHILAMLINIHSFPDNTKFTVKDLPTVIKNTGSYKGDLYVDQTYKNWATVIGETKFPFEFSEITIIEKSAIVYRQMPSGYDINNIEASLKNGSEIKTEVLDQFIKTSRFPPNVTFTMGAINKDIVSGKFTFDIIPNVHYVDGKSTDNTTTQNTYTVMIQFAASLNLGLIIGLSVGGVLLPIIAFLICRKIKMRKPKSVHVVK